MVSDSRMRIIVIAVLVLLGALAVHDPSKYKQGPDLAGGTIMIYQLVEPAADTNAKDRLLTSLKERLDPTGLKNYVIRFLGNDRVEIVMPQADNADIETVKSLISTVGQLQFRIVADRKRHAELMDRAVDVGGWPNKQIGVQGTFIRYGTYEPIIKTRPQNAALIAEAEKIWPAKKVKDDYRWVSIGQLDAIHADADKHVLKDGDDGRKYALAIWKPDGVDVQAPNHLTREDDDGNHYVLLYNDAEDVTGQYLTRVEQASLSREGNMGVAFHLNGTGGSKFYRLTSEFQPDPDGHKYLLGVVLDNRLRTAPNLNARISDSGEITGSFTQQDINNLIKVLAAGQLPVAVNKDPASVYRIAATLGKDTIHKATLSIGIALSLIVVFMISYYEVAGVVAIFGLLLNILFTVALMVITQATWTLPGLAGLVLTVGMSVDYNVLIFERVREELDRGASPTMALKLGYDRAWTTILDSNLTTLLTALILYIVATDQVKGFAITLILGILTSMFCAIWVTKAIFHVLIENNLLKQIKMRRFLTKPNIDFYGIRKIGYTVSVVTGVIGIIALIARGEKNFDIDFTGGTMVGLTFNKPLTPDQVREMATKSGIKDVSIEEMTLSDVAANTHYILRTTDRDADQAGAAKQGAESVRGKLATTFKEYLDLPHMKIAAIAPVLDAAPGGKPDPAKSAFKPFIGGERTTITFSEPRTTGSVRAQLNELLASANLPNPEVLYGIVPVGDSQAATESTVGEARYSNFAIAMKSNLKETLGNLQSKVQAAPDFNQFSQFGPQVAGDTKSRALWAIVLSWLVIIIYIWFRFGSAAWGYGGVVALVHDVFVASGLLAIVSSIAAIAPALGAFYITEMKMDLNAIAALLTLIGYSIHDTIVIFDRIREVKGRGTVVTPEIVNRATNETLSRTIITSALTLSSVVVLFFGGGATLRGFAFIMSVGIITGTYSSIYIASPLVVAITEWQSKRKGKQVGKVEKRVSTMAR